MLLPAEQFRENVFLTRVGSLLGPLVDGQTLTPAQWSGAVGQTAQLYRFKMIVEIQQDIVFDLHFNIFLKQRDSAAMLWSGSWFVVQRVAA